MARVKMLYIVLRTAMGAGGGALGDTLRHQPLGVLRKSGCSRCE